MTGFVYFARAGDFVKIGYSRNPEQRVRQFERFSPFPVRLVAQFPGTRAIERLLHCLFWHRHADLNWEWFAWCDEIETVVTGGLPSFPDSHDCKRNDCPYQDVRSDEWRARQSTAMRASWAQRKADAASVSAAS